MEKKAWHRRATFEREFAPVPELFAGERILGRIEAKRGDIGWFAYLLQRQERFVVTTHRIFQYSTNLLTSRLRCLELAKIEMIEVGSQFSVIQFGAGAAFFMAAILLVINAIIRHEGVGIWMIFSSLGAVAGVFMLLTSRKKGVRAATGSRNDVSIPLARLRAQEAKSFVDLLTGAMRNLADPATQPPSRRQNRESSEDPARPRTGEAPRFRKSAPTTTIPKQARQQQDNTLDYSPNNGEARDKDPSSSLDGWILASKRTRRTYTE